MGIVLGIDPAHGKKTAWAQVGPGGCLAWGFIDQFSSLAIKELYLKKAVPGSIAIEGQYLAYITDKKSGRKVLNVQTVLKLAAIRGRFEAIADLLDILFTVVAPAEWQTPLKGISTHKLNKVDRLYMDRLALNMIDKKIRPPGPLDNDVACAIHIADYVNRKNNFKARCEK